MRIAVYTAIFGAIDRLWSACPLAWGEAQRVCFTDAPDLREVGLWTQNGGLHYLRKTTGLAAIPAWEVRQVAATYGPRRTARHYKALAHYYLPDADVTIWVDGNVRLLAPPAALVKQYLGDADLAIFAHPDRACLYDEAAFCAKKGKDRATVLNRQTARYRAEGMPRKWGLPETRCVIRRNTERIADLNALWWHELQAHSVRDQVSLPYACWKLGLKWRVIPGRCWVRNDHRHFHFEKHKA